MKNEQQRVFHMIDENDKTLAKIIILREFNHFMGVIFVDLEPPIVEFEVFDDVNAIDHTIRNLIFKASLSGFKEIKEVEE